MTTQEITSAQATTTGGNIYAVNNFTDTNNPQGVAKTMIKKNTKAQAFMFANNTTFFKIVLATALQAGDVITAKGVCGTNADNDGLARGIWLSTADSRPTECTATMTIAPGSATAWGNLSSYTVSEGDGLAGATTIYLYRATAKSTYFNEFTITRTSGTDGIVTVRTALPSDNIYSLSGLHVATPRKNQLHVKDGKKFINK